MAVVLYSGVIVTAELVSVLQAATAAIPLLMSSLRKTYRAVIGTLPYSVPRRSTRNWYLCS